MAARQSKYDIKLLRRLWAAGVPCSRIAAALGCTVKGVWALRERYKLPVRRAHRREWQWGEDPTLEQIAERAAECRAMRVEKVPPPPVAYTAGIKVYAWRDGAFEGVA